MANYVKIPSEISELCAGDLRSKIIIKARSITPSSTDSVDYSETFTVIATVWALVKTIVTVYIAQFNDTNIDAAAGITATHTFYIRYRAGITAEHWIEFKNNYYDIVSVVNLEEMNHVTKILARLRGPKTYLINEA